MCKSCNRKEYPFGYGEYQTICPICGEYVGDEIPTTRDIVEHCAICDAELYEDDMCYYLYGQYFCEDCVHSANVKLDILGEQTWKEENSD